jgi:hypothetical protein
MVTQSRVNYEDGNEGWNDNDLGRGLLSGKNEENLPRNLEIQSWFQMTTFWIQV